MTRILSILVLYAFTLFVSFLSILMVGWKYKLNAKSQFIQYAFGVVMYFFFILSLNFMVAGNRILGLEENFGYHSVICMVLFMVAIFFAIAKNDPHAHDKVEFKFKKR